MDLAVRTRRRLAPRSVVLLMVLALWACSGETDADTAATPVDAEAPPTPVATARPTTTIASTTRTTSIPVATTATTTPLPPVEGREPSDRVAVFYYPWYGTPAEHGIWWHWENPDDITSDYYPVLGVYDSMDPAVVAQHFAWIREAGAGVVVTSWWGRGNQGIWEDAAVPLLLDMAERYGLGIAFHLEPYEGRSAESIVDDVAFIYDRYGDHPGFYRTTGDSLWMEGDRPKGLFFLWLASQPFGGAGTVDPAYWRDAVDRIHASPEGGIILADRGHGVWVDEGHFDGVYQYATLDEAPNFGWARTLPPGAWYVPSVLPGFSTKRLHGNDTADVERHEGATYRRHWEHALSTGIEPALVSITSFNEWHEGTQIEPATPFTRGSGNTYDDYGSLGESGYIALTAELVAAFLEMDWEDQAAGHVRILIETTSDWTVVTLESGGALSRVEVVSVSDTAMPYVEGADAGGRIDLLQPLEDAEAGISVSLALEVEVLNWTDPLRFRIERGALGLTDVRVIGLDDDGAETGVTAARWNGWSTATVNGVPNRNPFWFEVTAAQIGL